MTPDTATALPETTIPTGPPPPIRRPANPDHETDFRLSPEQIALLRPHMPRRYLARVHCFGEFVMPEDRRTFGIEASVIVRTTPAVGLELAESARGIPLNLARRRDGVLCHWTPDGPTAQLHGVHPEIHSGFVGRAWPDRFGVMAELLVFRGTIIPDLDIAELTGELWSCGLCLSFTALEQEISRVRFTGHRVADVRRARSYALDFSGLPISRGCRLLRHLDRDEAVLEEEGPPPDHRYVMANEQPTAAVALAANVVPGTVETNQLGDNSATSAKRQNVNSATHSPTWPSGAGGVTKSVEYSVSVSIGESYMGSWWADLPGSVTFDAAQAYGMVPVKQDTSNAKAWATTTLNIPTPTAIQGTFYYW